jgi:hypothetical protein
LNLSGAGKQSEKNQRYEIAKNEIAGIVGLISSQGRFRAPAG